MADNIEDDEEGKPVQIQFEFLNANDEMELSEEYTVKILSQKNQQSEYFEPNRLKIIKSCDFRTFEERIYYYMFDKTKQVFLTKDTDLTPFLKSNKIIMQNCKTFAEHICENLREESLTYKKEEDENKNEEELKKSDAISIKNEIRRILTYLAENFENDLFAEEFIINNGIQYIDKIIQHNSGNIRKYALKGLSKLLDFQSTFDYFDKKKEILSSLYTILVSDKDVLSPFCAIDIMIKIIRTSEEKIMYIIDVAEKYAKKTHTKIFDKLVDNLSERIKESNLKNYSLWFINMIMNYCHPSKLPRILIQLRDVGIFEILENRKHTDKNFETQVNMFLEKTQSVLLDSDYEVEIYKKEIEDLKTHCYEIEKRNISFSEENEFYEILVDEFIKYLDFSDCFITQAGITNDKT